MVMMRSIAAGLVLLGTLLAAGPAPAIERVKLSLNVLPYGTHIGFFVAREKGFYRDAGLDVEILKGEGAGDAVRRLGAGVVDFAFADMAAQIVGQTRGLKIKAVGVIYERDPSVIFSLKSTGIRTPKDLEGKSIGALTASSLRETWLAVAAANNVDRSKVTWVDMPLSAYGASLMSKKVDAVGTYVTTLPSFEPPAKRQGEEIAILFWADFGVDTYGAGIITSDEMIKGKPRLVRGFVDASMRGYAWAFEHPADAVKMFLKVHPEASEYHVTRAAKLTADLMVTPFAAREGIGHYDAEKVRRTRDLILQPRAIDPNTVPVSDIFTNEFLPKLSPKPQF